MYKRMERKRKRRVEEEELGLDQDGKEIMGLNDTDSDESDSDSDPDTGEDQEEGAFEDGDVDEDPPISVEEVLRDPVYLVSLDPRVHGCVLCKGKLIKNAGTVATHKNSKVHRRWFERFRLLSVDVDPRSNAWDLVRTIRAASNIPKVESQEPSKRALKRQAKQAAIHEKRKRHKELKAKAMAKKALQKLAADGKAAASSRANLRGSPESQNRPGKPPKKQKLESNTTTSGTRDVTAKSASRTKSSSESKKSILKSRIKGTGKANEPS